ncbi:MAG: SCO family protein [Leptospiraceae bacterium]|nr:SCO family protein [Leptospiraceae bacterium]MCP5499191.1 SCO family protein [Leptospiraceae bacterium]
MVFKILFLYFFICVSGLSLLAYDPSKQPVKNETPTHLKDIGVDERPGASLSLDTVFRDEKGEERPLSSFFKQQKPILLALVYFSCPNLCNYQLNGLTKSLKKLDWLTGKQFEVMAISIDPKEDSTLAAQKKEAYLNEYARSGASEGWHFLTGKEESIHKIAGEVGFRYKWNPEAEQWAHAAATYVLTPDGRISRYLYGIDFDPQTVKLSLVEASNGKIGNFVDRVLLFCFQFDPKLNRYTLFAYNLMRVAAGLTVLFIGAFMLLFWFKQKKSKEIQGVHR